MPRDEERAGWEAVRAFGLVAATLSDPVPGLMVDLTAPEERLRELEREQPLASFSPFGTLPDDIANYGAEPAYTSDEATGNPDPPVFRESTMSGAENPPRAASPRDQPPIFSFRRGGASGTSAVRRDGREDPTDSDRGRSHVSGTAQDDPQTPATPAYRETTQGRGNRDPASGALLADPMSLLDGLAEDALGATREVPLQPAKASPRTNRSPEPGAQDGEADAPIVFQSRSAEGLTDAVGGTLDVAGQAHLATTTGFRDVEPYGGGAHSLIDSLVEDLLSTSMPEDPPAAEANAPEMADRSGEMVAPDRSAFAALSSEFDGPDDRPSGQEMLDDEVMEKAPEHFADPDAFAELVNDVLVRQARRHGVDLS